MPLFDAPKPEIPKRRYYAKINEPLAITTEKYAEFLQTDGVDLVTREHAPVTHPCSTLDRLLDVKEAAALLNVPVSWIYQHVRARTEDKLPHLKLGKYLRFSALALTRWLEGRRIGSQTRLAVDQSSHIEAHRR
jgi:excisionase family DNA binding protein